MGRIKADRFITFMNRGATRPFLVEDNNKLKWVIKVVGNPFGTQAVFNELVVGGLAVEIGLPWPKPSIVELSPSILEYLEKNGVKASTNIAVGTEYLNDITPVEFPDDFDIADKTKNASYIRHLFPDEKKIDIFYGKSIFDNWMLFLNDTKYDTLQRSHNGDPVFLDATFALGYYDLDWDEGKLFWRDTAIILDRSPYLCGIITDMSKYEPWINNILQISDDKINRIINSTPIEWGVPDSYLDTLKHFVNSTPQIFMPLFRNCMEFESYAG